ncbi:MAG: selenium-dependent xanthine dehydrogenase [Planctomycetes bacterium]|nr:selenium-dependent xanthine dehydrogenase [Planctomycetota bacterium]
MVKVTVNGVEHEYTGDEGRWLLDWLRTDLGIRSPKDGCMPQAACGCCAVGLDDKVVLACATPMKKVAGARVRTLEGLDDRVRDVFADSFATCGGAQCAFCIPGIVMRSAVLLEHDPEPSRESIEKDLRFHLCRCTGYKKIIGSIERAAETLRDGGSVPLPQAEGDDDGRVGTRLPKYGIRQAVLGERPYVADMSVDGMLHGAVRLSDHPRAIVRRIDASEAAGMPGVARVFTAADVPGQRSIGLIVPDWPLVVAEGETTRYVGDVIACVAAESRDQARAAAERIHVEYEVLDPITDVDAALAPDAPPIHAGGNCLSTTIVRRGDVDDAFSECAHVTEATYETQRIEHAFLEPEAALAVPSDNGLHVYSQGQGVYEDRRQIALLLGLDEASVNVELVPNGGGFGGKEDLCVQGHAAVMAAALGRAVHVEITRDESIRMHPKRHPIRMHYTLGCTAEGRLHALRARIVGDTGAYASVGMKVLERAAGHSCGAYDVPNVDVEARAVYTNNVPCGAMRGFGANQANFAVECAVDELCAMGGFDRWQFRHDNALTDGGCTATGQRLSSGVGVRATLEAVEDAFRGAKHAGIACGIKNTGIGNGMPDDGTALIVIRGADHVELRHGWTEMGQGVDTMAVQTFCEETGLPPEIVRVGVDTDSETPCGMTTASRATSLVGNAIIDACRGLRADLAEYALADLVGRSYRGTWVCDWTNKPGTSKTGEEVTHYSYSYATQVVIVGDDGAIERVVAAHDAGRIMNPTLFEGQIEGSVHMGLGYALTENLPMEGGRLLSTRLRKCGVLRAAETPDIEVIGVEVPDEHGPYGAKGVGEIGLVPTAPAVANALWSCDGVRRRTLPMKGAANGSGAR